MGREHCIAIRFRYLHFAHSHTSTQLQRTEDFKEMPMKAIDVIPSATLEPGDQFPFFCIAEDNFKKIFQRDFRCETPRYKVNKS